MSDSGHTLELPILDEIGKALYTAAAAADQGRHAPRLRTVARWLRRPLVVAIGVIGASGAMGGLALAGTFSSTTISPQAWVDGQRVMPEQAPTPEQTASLAILRRPRVAVDALPAYYSQVLTNTPAAGQGANVALARRAYGFSNGAAGWVIPANDGAICLVAANAQALREISEPTTEHIHVPGANDDVQCEAAATVITGWPLAYGSDGTTPGMNFTAGIVPDGVSQVSVGVTDGTITTFPVHDNVWMGEVPGQPDSEHFNGPSGPVTASWPAGA